MISELIHLIFNFTTNLHTFSLSNNLLEGPIPDGFGKVMNSLELLHLISNKLQGQIPTSIGNILENNKLQGEIPTSIGNVCTLQILHLENNKLEGEIPASLGNICTLNNSQLIREIPQGIGALKSCTCLYILDVRENLLFGPIPSWIGESLQQLQILSLRVNRFFRSVPVHLYYLSQVHLLDLSRNHLSGGIPTSQEFYFNLCVWNHKFLLNSITLSSNDLLGFISLNLSRSHFYGEIPSKIGNLNSLEFLNLSINHISGKIPLTLSNINRLAELDISNSNLNGRIPLGRQLQTFDASSFERNIGLCGQ
uniref:LRR receptor-like serine/threonine-protein kinase At4g08850 family n=1 Tax=Cajanus cajan TaxID=3821 RepID=A0A151QT34_CAJCA|nr:putative LRR receptor-like serine/threonine-protein kinase At4g08850 family [Cajanus cajan]